MYLQICIFISGITSNLFFIALVCMISWYQIVHSEEYREYVKKKELLDANELDLDGGKYLLFF